MQMGRTMKDFGQVRTKSLQVVVMNEEDEIVGGPSINIDKLNLTNP